MVCKVCGRKLLPVEAALTKKLVNRGSTEFLCLSCLAAHFSVSEKTLLQKAEDFKESGCSLFADISLP